MPVRQRNILLLPWVGPAEDPTFHHLDPAVARSLDQPGGFVAAQRDLAVADDLPRFVLGQLAQSPTQGTQGDQRLDAQAYGLELVQTADVQKKELLPCSVSP